MLIFINVMLMDFICEFFRFLVDRKKYWLLPLIIILLLFSVLIVFTQGSSLAPFIYSMF